MWPEFYPSGSGRQSIRCLSKCMSALFRFPFAVNQYRRTIEIRNDLINSGKSLQHRSTVFDQLHKQSQRESILSLLKIGNESWHKRSRRSDVFGSRSATT